MPTAPASFLHGETSVSTACTAPGAPPGAVNTEIDWVNLHTTFAGQSGVPGFAEQTQRQKVTTLVREFGHALGLTHFEVAQNDCAGMQIMQIHMDDIDPCISPPAPPR